MGRKGRTMARPKRLSRGPCRRKGWVQGGRTEGKEEVRS